MTQILALLQKVDAEYVISFHNHMTGNVCLVNCVDLRRGRYCKYSKPID